MKFLIMGGLGFLGSNLSKRVLNKNQELVIVDNFTRNGCELNLEWLEKQGKFSLIREDIRHKEKVGNIVKTVQPDVIFHVAGQVAVTSSLDNPREDFEVNALGTFNIVEAIKNFSPDSVLIFSSTNKVYGDLVHLKYSESATRYAADRFPRGFNEDLKLNFQTPYGCSKGVADQYVLDYGRMFELKTIVFRHSAIYGPRQYPTLGQGWISWFCLKALEYKYKALKNELIVFGNGKQVRDILYVDDVVNLYFNSIKKINDMKGEPYNIGGGIKNSISIMELIHYFEQELDISLPYKMEKNRKADQLVFISDNTKVEKLIGWKPKIPMKEGLKKLIKWVQLNLVHE